MSLYVSQFWTRLRKNRIETIAFHNSDKKLLHAIFLRLSSPKAIKDSATKQNAVCNEAKMAFKGARSRLPRGTYFRERIPP